MNTLTHIVEHEQKADAIIAAARQQADSALAQAEKSRQSSIEAAHEQVLKDRQVALLEHDKLVAAEVAQLEGQAEQQRAALRARAEKYRQSAVETLIQSHS